MIKTFITQLTNKTGTYVAPRKRDIEYKKIYTIKILIITINNV